MIKYWLKFKFRILRLLNNDEPSSQECEWSYRYLITISKNTKEAISMRAYGFSLEEISKQQNVTRERVRQLIHKGVRMSWQEYLNNEKNKT